MVDGAGARRQVELEVVVVLGGGQLDAALRQERLEGRDGVLVELVLEHERVELVRLDLAALLRLGGERIQCRNLDDAGLQVVFFLASFSDARRRHTRACVVCVLRCERRSRLRPSRRRSL